MYIPDDDKHMVSSHLKIFKAFGEDHMRRLVTKVKAMPQIMYITIQNIKCMLFSDGLMQMGIKCFYCSKGQDSMAAWSCLKGWEALGKTRYRGRECMLKSSCQKLEHKSPEGLGNASRGT